METAYTGQLIQHSAIHILNHTLAKITTRNKLTNPQIESELVKIISLDANPT